MPELPPELDHWHPVLRGADLGWRPRSVTLLDLELALFRTRSGRLGALVDECPHRRMRLSRGWVEGDRLVCPYHGFAYAPDGAGESPSTPRMRLHACALEAVERHGAIWVRRAGAATAFPDIVRAGTYPVGVLIHEVRAPLETVVDNFCEVEHTPTTHALFGYPRESLGDIEVDFTIEEDRVRVVNRGPQKRIPRVVERLFGVRTGDAFIDDWTVRFSPVHIIYHQWWETPGTGEPRPDSVHLAVFFNPIDRHTTQLVTFPFASRPPLGRLGLNLLLRPFVRALIDREVRLDRQMLERLADPRPDLRGLRLSRFDRPLRAHRERIEGIYRRAAT